MGRGPELTGDIKTRLFTDAVDGPVVAPDGVRLSDHLADRYGCDEDYVRQMLNDLENRGAIYIERVGPIAVAYDIHPAHICRSDAPWTPTQMLGALVEAADRNDVVTMERYDSFPVEGRPGSDLIARTFRSWDRAASAAGLVGEERSTLTDPGPAEA